MNSAAQALRAERDFWSTLSGELRPASPMRSLADARSTQHALDAAVCLRLPVGDAREIDPADLMPHERAALFGWADTQVQP